MAVLQVASLLDRVERVQNTPFHINIHTALSRHHMAVCVTQARRKEEIANMSKHDKAHFTEARGNSYRSVRHMCSSCSDTASPNSLLSHRHPVAGHCTEGPRCYNEKAPHSPVVCSPDDPTAA